MIFNGSSIFLSFYNFNIEFSTNLPCFVFPAFGFQNIHIGDIIGCKVSSVDKNGNVSFDVSVHKDEKNSLVTAFARKTELEGLHPSLYFYSMDSLFFCVFKSIIKRNVMDLF